MAILNSNGLYLDVIEKNDNSTVQNIQGDARILCMDGCSEISLSYPNFQNIKDENSLKGICVTIMNFKNEGSINLIGFTGPKLTLDKGDSINCYWTGNSWINGDGNASSVNGKEPDNATGNITLYGTDILTSETERINIIEKIKQYVGTTLLGRYWTQSNKTDGSFVGGARYANGIWVACGDNNGGLWYSTDGKNWAQSNNTDGYFKGGARYANGIWVACSDNGNGLWYSTDGMNWTQSNKTNGYFGGGARYANGIWVACGMNNIGLWYSTDGMNWTQSNKTDDSFYGGARYANGIWVACNSNAHGLWYSTDGKNWTQSNKTDGSFSGGARYANGIWVACSDNGNGLWYSTDGINWTQSNKTDGSFYGGARYANGIWVACSTNRNGLWYSDVQTLIDNGWLK